MPDAAGIFARRADHAADRVRVLLVDDVEVHDARRIDVAVALLEALLVAVQPEDRQPVALAARVAREGLVDVDDAREVLGPLDVAREPEAVLGES